MDKKKIKEFLGSITEPQKPEDRHLEPVHPFVDEKGVFLPRLADLLDYIRPISDFDTLIAYRDFLREEFEVSDFLGDSAIYAYVEYFTVKSQGNSQFYKVNGEQVFNQDPDGSYLYWHYYNMEGMLDNSNKIYFK